MNILRDFSFGVFGILLGILGVFGLDAILGLAR